MEFAVKYAAVVLLCSAACLLIKRSNTETAFLMSVSAVTVVYIAVCRIMQEALGELNSAAAVFGTSSQLVRPVLKCIGIAFVSRFSADLCRDASQSALASAMETAGTVFAAAVAMPSVISMMKMIGGFI